MALCDGRIWDQAVPDTQTLLCTGGAHWLGTQSANQRLPGLRNQKECDFLYLQHETELNKGNLSSHLARLEEAGYVEIEKIFRGKMPRTLLRLTATGRSAFEQYSKKLKGALQS